MLEVTTFSKAKARLLVKHPFFAVMVLQTEYRENKKIPTARTNMRWVEYNPKFIDSLTTDVVMFVIVHEIAHIFLKHGFRGKGKNGGKWNIACDHAINIMLKDAGMDIWDKCYCDFKYRGMSAEQIYDVLPDDPSGDGIGGDLMPPEDLSPDEQYEVERQIDQMVAGATVQARQMGRMPGNMDRIVDGLLNPPLPWYMLLADYMQRVTHETETWNRRNRRFEGVYLPSRWNHAMGEFVLIGDTSSSMDNQVFAQIGVEVNHAIETVKPERVRIVWADDEECSNQEVFEPGEEVILHPKGGGGTDMRLALSFVEQYDPCVVILVTDCLTPWPRNPTPFPLIVVSTSGASSPDWALRVQVNL